MENKGEFKLNNGNELERNSNNEIQQNHHEDTQKEKIGSCGRVCATCKIPNCNK